MRRPGRGGGGGKTHEDHHDNEVARKAGPECSRSAGISCHLDNMQLEVLTRFETKKLQPRQVVAMD